MDAPRPTVTLRALVPADAAVIAEWGSDPAFARVADWSPDRSLADRTAFQERLIVSPPPDLLRWGVEHEGSLVGFVNLAGDGPDGRELGFLVGGSSRWGRGLGRAAAGAGLDLAFGDLGLALVWAEAYDAHRRSVRILQGLGLRETGRGEDGSFLGLPTFYRRFEITAGEWRPATG